MTNKKRIIIATLIGLVTGIICMTMASSNPEETISLGLKLSILSGRTLIGFMIGISILKLPWAIHGILLGIIGSIPMALPIMDRPGIMVATVVMGIIYGFLIELVTSVVFKAKHN